MKIVRYQHNDGSVRIGVLRDGVVADLATPDIASLLQQRVENIRDLVKRAVSNEQVTAVESVRLLAPIDGRTEVWGAGVTYSKSRSARAEESRFDRVYLDVYNAHRPELFFKSVAWRVVTDSEEAGIRADSTDSVPEPELALVLNQHAEVVGALVCNDLTSRSVEAENPIYLPQSKTYTGSCVLSSGITPWWEITTPDNLGVTLKIQRAGEAVFEGGTSTSSMKRTSEELVRWLFSAMKFPDGVVLSTGTGIVPPLGWTVLPGDVVSVSVEQVGTVVNELTSVGVVITEVAG